jgi:hypothetical protein
MPAMPPDHDDDGAPGQPARDAERLHALLGAVERPAPAALQRRIAELAAAPPRRRRMFVLAPAGVFAVTLAALVIVLWTGRITAPPSTLGVSRIALAGSNASAPARLVAADTQIVFPHWSHWPSAGTRSDRTGGRIVTTEFYSSSAAGRIGYSIVSGAPLRYPAGARGLEHAGERYGVIASHGTQIVTWVQSGHTCVLASRTAPASTLFALAVAQYSGAPV